MRRTQMSLASRTVRSLLLLGLVALIACSHASSSPANPPAADAGDAGDPAAAVQVRVTQTLGDLAAFGSKHAGTDPGRQAGDYLTGRWQQAGLADVHTESFSFPAFQVSSSNLAVVVDGASVSMGHEVFAYSGAGHADADVVFVGKGHATDYAGKSTTGKIVLLQRDPYFHRQAQFQLVAQHGGVAMLYVSTSPSNLIQIGTVSEPEDGLGAIPAVTVGADDGQKMIDALTAGQTVHATIDVAASVSPAQGRNVIGKLSGSDPSSAYLLVGAHYDTWYQGSVDNGTGIATTLAIAEDFARAGGRKLGVVFVAYDGEELGLFGGYDYLRKHVVVGNGPMLGWVNFEMPANDDDGVKALAHTNGGPIDGALGDNNLRQVYGLYAGMEAVPPLFGGIIPTDIQGMYWYGLQGMTTACDSPYYHTNQDTPDKVDTKMLASAVLHFEAALDELDNSTPASYEVHDPTLWKPDVTATKDAGGNLVVSVVAKDATGAPQAVAAIAAWVDVDDFTRASLQTAKGDANGAASFSFTAADLAKGQGSRWLHVTAGQTYPLAEVIRSL
jgi:hypothetical protein